MIVPERFENKDLLDAVSKGVRILMIRTPLVGFLLAGSAIKIVQGRGENAIAYTDGVRIFCCPRMLDFDPDTLRFILVHELIHILFNHCKRGVGKISDVWLIAVEYHANGEAESITGTPTHASFSVRPEPWAHEMTTEEIYDELLTNFESLQKHNPDTTLEDLTESILGDAQSDVMAPAEDCDDDFEGELRQDSAIAQTAQDEAISRNTSIKRVGGKLGDRVAKLTRARVPWDRIVINTVQSAFEGELPTYSPPRRQTFPWLIQPSYFKRTVGKLFIPVDVSGSVIQHYLDQFFTVMQQAASIADEIRVVTFDAVVRSDVIVRHPGEMKNIRLTHGAHSMTSVLEVFKIAEEYKPNMISVCTDGLVEYPKKRFDNTLWIVPEKHGVAPWGRQIVMQETW